MGKNLYEELSKKLDGGTLAIQFILDDYSEFEYTNGSISISNQLPESNALFHEMWHAYQAYSESQITYPSAILNLEIEARYAQYLYVRELPEYSGNKWENWYNKDPLCISIARIENQVNDNGQIVSGNTDLSLDNYLINRILPSLIKQSGYANGTYDYNRGGIQNFSNLQTLSKNC